LGQELTVSQSHTSSYSWWGRFITLGGEGMVVKAFSSAVFVP